MYDENEQEQEQGRQSPDIGRAVDKAKDIKRVKELADKAKARRQFEASKQAAARTSSAVGHAGAGGAPASGAAAGGAAPSSAAVGATSGAGAGATATGAGAAGATAGAAEGAAAAAGSTAAAAEGGAAAVSAGAAGATAAAPFVLLAVVIIIVLLLLLLIFTVVCAIPFATTNDVMHQNTPAAAAAGVDVISYKMPSEVLAGIAESHLEMSQRISDCLAVAGQSAASNLRSAARDSGWTLECSPEVPPLSNPEETYVFWASAYSAANHNGVDANSIEQYSDVSILDDMENALIRYSSEAPKTTPYGNAIYEADFARDETGNIKIRTVAHSSTNPLTGETSISYTHYVTPVIYEVDAARVASDAFLPDGITMDSPYDSYDCSSIAYWNMYADDATDQPFGVINSQETYWDMTVTMSMVLGEILYGTDFWANSDSAWASYMTSYGGGCSSIVDVAKAQIGNRGGRTYWSWGGFSSRVPWCACFVSWCADQCGFVESGIVPKTASSTAFADFYARLGRYYPRSSSYTPKAGDFILFLYSRDAARGYRFSHIALVSSCDGSKVYTIEGNNGDAVKEASYSLSNSDIAGYCSPAYPTETSSSSELCWPLPEKWVTVNSFFGPRSDPFTGQTSNHSGTDIGAASGTPIYAAHNGTVTSSTYHNSYGNYVKISRGDGLSTLYAHMSRRAVNAGDIVTKGQIIGYVGSTGRSTGPHLHFEVRIDDVKKDALKYYPTVNWVNNTGFKYN